MSQSSRFIQGRLGARTDAFVEAFSESVSYDRRLCRHDLQGSAAHCRMLGRAGILSEAEAEQILAGLDRIGQAVEAGNFEWRADLEDVHMNIEQRLIELIGDAGKKLHTARSRNDQTSTALRLYLREEIDDLTALIDGLQLALLDQAEAHCDTPMPGFTHLQSAQPITFGFHLMAWCEMLRRDRARLRDCRARVNIMPLGAGALAGTSFPIDRHYTCRLLGFEAPADNALDAVSDRDFALEFAAVAAIALTHFSRWCEELVLWSSPQFGFVRLPDSFCTGSSIMPQKKNPDVPELVRGKTGRVLGDLMALLTLMKSQPLAYNRDSQEDKPPLFDAVDTLKVCIEAMLRLIPKIETDADAMRVAALSGFSTATDLADYLVRKGMPFRDAHRAVGKAVAWALEEKLRLDEIPLARLRALVSAEVGPEVFEALTLEGSIGARKHTGGTAPEAVRASIRARRAELQAST